MIWTVGVTSIYRILKLTVILVEKKIPHPSQSCWPMKNCCVEFCILKLKILMDEMDRVICIFMCKLQLDAHVQHALSTRPYVVVVSCENNKQMVDDGLFCDRRGVWY